MWQGSPPIFHFKNISLPKKKDNLARPSKNEILSDMYFLTRIATLDQKK